jgi:hypothetical protein
MLSWFSSRTIGLNSGVAFNKPLMYRNIDRACGRFAAKTAMVATSPAAR